MSKPIYYAGLIIAGTVFGIIYFITSLSIIIFGMAMTIEADINAAITGVVLLSGIITIGLIIINLIEGSHQFLKFLSRYQ